MSLTVLALRECWQILCGVGVLYPADGGVWLIGGTSLSF